jgi:hypothetical protein
MLFLGLLIAIAATTGSAQGESKETGTQNQIYLPIALRNYDYDPRFTSPPFGVQLYGNSSATSVWHSELLDSNATWLRINVMWGRAEPKDVDPAAFDWFLVDRALAAARQDSGGLRIIAEFRDNPSWAATYPNGPIHASKLGDFAEFVGALVERFDGDGFKDAPGSPVIEFWEFYNEPDLGSRGANTGWGNHGAEYARMLSVARGAVKAANPDAYVVLGGIAYEWFEDMGGPFVRRFLDDVLAAGGGNYFDIMNFHIYPFNSYREKSIGLGILEKTGVIRNKLGQYGQWDKAAIITESGWYRNMDTGIPASPEIQARYVAALFTESMAADIEVMIWWMLRDPGPGWFDYGLVTFNEPVARMPSFYAYQTVAAELSTAKFDRQLTPAETGADGLVAYLFQDFENGRTIHIAWLEPLHSEEVKELQLPASSATVRDIYGEAQVIADGDDGALDGNVVVPVGGQPVYVEIGY